MKIQASKEISKSVVINHKVNMRNEKVMDDQETKKTLEFLA